ncbi:TIGR04388 family protein [Leptospira interrogans]|uniref:TIGR04388 family protein n=1 Tax=Leptospira interrogans TaxID=173 RepID=UPI0022AB1F32|nr:TIGR04388 family protein [Leptospira interrogans]
MGSANALGKMGFRGKYATSESYGGGISANIAGSKALPVGEAMQAFAAAMKMSNLSLGLSYNRDAGLGMNVNANFTNHLGLGLDYNFKSGDYTANASYDFDKVGGKDWANASLGISASKNGHASASVSYNTDGNTAIPQALRGSGATLDFGNDGLIGLSVQAMRGATVGTLTYDTNTHGFQPLTLNNNYQNEFNQGQAAENAAYNHQKGQMEILMKELGLGTKMDKPLFTQAEIDAALPKDEHGNLDMEKANPEKLLDKWNAHKEAMSKTPEGLQKWKDEVSKAGERSGIEVKFNDGKSATSTFGKFVTGLLGDVAQSFGFANDGSEMVDKAGVFHLDTCMRGDVPVFKLKNKNIKIYGNINSTEMNSNKFGSDDYDLVAIERIQIGDVVRSWNENTNTFENKRVTETFVHEVPQLFFLELDGEEEIHTTWNHPFRRYRATQESETNRNERQSAGYGVERGFENHSVEHSRNVALENRDMTETSHLTPNQLAPNVSKILATGNYSLTPQSEWVKVEDLRLRDQVLRSDGSWGTVTGIYYYNTEPTKVYNLEVEDNHTYIVGGDALGIGYVVHNYIVDQKDKFLSGAEVEKAYKDHKKMGEKAEIKWGDKTYKKVNGEGEGVAVFVRDYDEKGTKEYIRITKDGLIEQKIKWKGQLGEFMANTLSGEKTKYFNTRGEEVSLQPDKLVRDGGSKKLPFDPVDTKLANNIVDKVKNDYEQSLRTEYANDKKSKLTAAQIDVKVKAEMAVYNRIADRTFRNSYTDENGNAIKHGSDEFLAKIAEPEFNGQNSTKKPDGMEIPVKVVIEYMRSKYPDGKGYAPNLAPWNERIATHKEKLNDLNVELKTGLQKEGMSDKERKSFQKDMEKKIASESNKMYAVETERRHRMEEFEKSSNLIFGKNSKGEYNVSSSEIAKQTKAAICRADTNYLQNRVNGRMEASFGEYFMNKVEMGDIRPGTGQTKGLVWDNGYLKGYDDQYPPKGQDGIPDGFDASNEYTGEPLSHDYIQEVTANMKPGQAIQVWADTDVNKGNNSKPGPNHYYEISMNSKGEFVYLNHTGEAVQYFDKDGKPSWLKHNFPIPREAWKSLRIFRVYK